MHVRQVPQGLVRVIAGVALVSFAANAWAEAPLPRVVTLPRVQVKGRVQTPLAAVEISRVEPKLALNELRPAFGDRIARAVGRDPY